MFDEETGDHFKWRVAHFLLLALAFVVYLNLCRLATNGVASGAGAAAKLKFNALSNVVL